MKLGDKPNPGDTWTVIFRCLGHNRDIIEGWPITARDMDENEKRFFRKK